MQNDDRNRRSANGLAFYNRIVVLLLVVAAIVVVGSIAAAIWKYASVSDVDPIFQVLLGSCALLAGLLVVNEIMRRWW